MQTPKEHSWWFPAKTSGYGWGPPTRWQGWAVLIAIFALLGASAVWLLPQHRQVEFVASAVGLCVLLVLVCWWKGEKPGSRWGSSEPSDRRG